MDWKQSDPEPEEEEGNNTVALAVDTGWEAAGFPEHSLGEVGELSSSSAELAVVRRMKVRSNSSIKRQSINKNLKENKTPETL